MIRVVVADDHPVVLEGVVQILSTEPDVRVVGKARSGRQAIDLVGRHLPDVLVLDGRLADMTGAEVTTHLAGTHPRVRVVILTSFPNEGAILAAFRAGARSFVPKTSEPAVLREAVRTVVAGGTYVDATTAAKLVVLATRGRRTKGPFGLTLQEMRVVELVPRGLSNRQIGAALNISEDTVKTHMHHALRKLKATSRAQAAAIAAREGLS